MKDSNPYWNIGVVGNKLENQKQLNILKGYDVIWISELKTDRHGSSFTRFQVLLQYMSI